MRARTHSANYWAEVVGRLYQTKHDLSASHHRMLGDRVADAARCFRLSLSFTSSLESPADHDLAPGRADRSDWRQPRPGSPLARHG
jgi:hypothetical protein